MPALSALAGFFLLAGLVLALGAATGSLVARDAALDAERTTRRLGRLGLAATAVLVVGLVLVFVRQLLEFRDPFVPWQEDARLLSSTPWGVRLLTALAGTAVAAAGFGLLAAGRRGAWWIAAPAVLAVAVFPALTGHASAGGAPGVTVPADVLHVWAAGAWVGGLAAVLWLERAHRRDDGVGGSLLPVLVPRFSRVAQVAVATLVATGSLAAVVHLSSPADLVTTAYGRWLLAKLATVAGVLALGALNWRRLAPGLATPEGPARLRRAAVWELALGQAVLLVTAVLVHTPPPPP